MNLQEIGGTGKASSRGNLSSFFEVGSVISLCFQRLQDHAKSAVVVLLQFDEKTSFSLFMYCTLYFCISTTFFLDNYISTTLPLL